MFRGVLGVYIWCTYMYNGCLKGVHMVMNVYIGCIKGCIKGHTLTFFFTYPNVIISPVTGSILGCAEKLCSIFPP